MKRGTRPRKNRIEVVYRYDNHQQWLIIIPILDLVATRSIWR
jgi:hypothetical protein